MKKVLLILIVALFAFTLAACGEDSTELKITFVPSRDPEEILEFVEPLEEMLKAKLAEKGYDFDKVTVEVSATYEAAGEALDAGTTDVAFLPGGTYALYSEDGNIEVILAATRNGLNKDSADAEDWNDGLATLPTENQVTYYRSIVVAGPSAKGRELADKVNAGTALTWEDLNSAIWGTQGATSSAGTVYPSVYLFQNYDKKVTDLTQAAPAGSYGNSIAGLATGTYDLVTLYADARRDYAEAWTTTHGRSESIWAETDVIIVTSGIFNDTISTSKKTVDAGLKVALQEAFMELVATPEGLAVFAVYSHAGYAIATDADYEAARIAQQIVAGN